MNVRMASPYPAETRSRANRNDISWPLSLPNAMKRYAPYFAFGVGIAVIAVLMPRFNAAQPRGIRLTRGDIVPISDAAARSIGIPVDQTWAVTTWSPSYRLEKELDTQ